MKFIHPSEPGGTIPAPPSKSMMIRAVAAGFLSPAGTVILNPSFCEDALSALNLVQDLGSRVHAAANRIKMTGRPETPESRRLNCGESGLCIRLFSPIAALYRGAFQITGKGTLLSRPMRELEPAFHSAGACCFTKNGTPPLYLTGPVQGGRIHINGRTGSQILSGFLAALPLCPQDSQIQVDHPVSLPYIRMTLSVLKDFGIQVHHNQDLTAFDIPGRQMYQRIQYRIEGDWSGAAFWLAAAAIKGDVTITGLNRRSFQADRRILTAVEATGAEIDGTPDSIRVKSGMKSPFSFDAAHCPDLFPPLAVMACFCRGRSVLKGVHRLIHKESNRAETLLSELKRIGGDIQIKGDAMIIQGKSLIGGTIYSHQDHRIAMAGAVAGILSRDGVGIRDWPAVRKSYPEFFNDLQKLGGKIR